MYAGTTLDRYLLGKLNSGVTMGSTSYLSKPRLGARSAYGNATTDKENYHKNKKSRFRKSAPKMSEYGIKKRLPDYTEYAYKEAVSRLRYFLSESYAPSSRSSKAGAASIKNLDESGDEGYDFASKLKYPITTYGGLRTYNPVYFPPSKTSILSKRYPFYPRDNYRSYIPTDKTVPLHINANETNPVLSGGPISEQSNLGKYPSGDPDLMGFIQKQEEYIEQLERESSYCRDELNNLLGKVKEVISENESLHEKQKNHLISSVMEGRTNARISDSDENDGDSTGLESDGKYSSVKTKKSSLKPSRRLEGPNIVFESKISELEAQLTQANIALKKFQEDNSEYRKKVSEGILDSPCIDSFKRQIDNLQREKTALEAQVSRLKDSLDGQKEMDTDLVSKMKRSADAAYQASHEKTQLEMEIRRLREEVERQQSRVRELLADQARRVMEERGAVERRYCSQVDQLQSDLTTHWDSATKLQLELERQRREEADLKRELVQKNSQIEDLKLELKNKIASLQADLAQAHADKSAVEEELASSRLMLERHQRQAKHDANRLNSEVQSVRQRLDRADADLVHSRRENLRLIDQIANIEKEMNLKSLRPASPISNKEKEANKEKELSDMIMNMESKHAQTVSELEAMVCSQNSLMEKLTGQCHLLTSKLDDASQRHKQEMASLQNNLDRLSMRVSQNSHNNDSNLTTARPSHFTDPPPGNSRPHEQISRQNSSQFRNVRPGDQHSVEDSADPRRIPPGPAGAEPNPSRALSRQSSKNNIQASDRLRQSAVGNVESVPDSPHTVLPTREEEQFEKKLRESENPDIDPTSIPQAVDDSQHNLNYPSNDGRAYSGQELFGEPNSEMEFTEGDATQQAYAADDRQYQAYDPQYADPDQQYVTDPSQQYVADPDQQYAADPNQQYATDPNQQYATDPNQQYADDPNQQYSDPNQQYQDPNEQYPTDYTDQQYADQNQEYAQ